MQARKEKRKNALRALLWAWGILVSCLLVFFSGRANRVVAEEEPENTYQIGSAADFAAYSAMYNAGNRNPHDTLNISIQSGLAVTDYNFVSLGTESRPFAGTLNIPTSGVDVFDLFDCPLFDYVTTDLTVTGGGTVKIQRDAIVETPPEGALTHGALFANHVVSGTSNTASWTISLEGGTATSYEGLIGTIAAGCDVTISFTNVTNIPISGSSSIGYICGTLGDGASLAVTTAGSGSALSISTTGGHAGGIVGMMGEDAILELNSANNTRVNSVSTAEGYAGGVVGYVDHVSNSSGIVLGVTDYAVSGSVTGGNGAGGLFGYYRSYVTDENDQDVELNLSNTYAIASGMTVSSSGNTGGVFGYLINYGDPITFNGNAAGGETLTLSLPSGSARGGVAGRFTTNNLANRLTVTNVAVTLTANTTTSAAGNATDNDVGGLIGLVAEAPAYIAVSNVRVTSAGTSNNSAPGAGLVGDPGTGGSFVDVSGNVTVSGRFYAGLIESLSEGVLRLAGTTDLSSYVQHNTSNDFTSGVVVRIRGRSLVYARGDGEGAGSPGWTLKRNTASPNTIDDIFSWGEVLRIDNSTLTEAGIFTVDMTAHTVTVNSGVTTITDENAFAKTALNVQLGTAAGLGALQFQTANQSATLLAANLTLDDDIDLSGTGLLGMTRDDGSNAAYTGTFDGDGHTLTLAIGEVWGLTSTGTALPASSIAGYIRRHKYNALFAKTNGATFENLTLSGVCQILQDVDTTYLAGLSAYATGGLTLTDVTMTDDASTGLRINYMLGTNYTTYVGGAVGFATGNSLNVSVSGGAYRPRITDSTASDKTAGKKTYVGGVIGYVSGGSSQTISFDSTTIGLTYSKPDNTKRESCFGSAIAGTSNQAYAKNKRKITLTDVDVEMSATGTAVSKNFGGILGTLWLSADVTLDGVDIVSASVTERTGSAANFGGLVQTATGYWDVLDFKLTSANFSVARSGSTFGLLVNKTWSTESSAQTALYLELDNTGAHYNIGGTDALTFTGSTGTFSSFDEIAADTRYNGRAIVQNGNSIVSIKTSDNVINTSGSQNTYLNKTDYGKSANGATNPNARYYYNIGYAVSNIATAKYNLLVWSVKQYAHSSLSSWFGSPSSTITGTIDLTGLSYYPIDLSTDVTFTAASVKLDNITMQANVKKAYATDDAGSRSTRSSSQHYLMHAGLFLNADANLSASGLTLLGNVPKISNDICGFLIAKKLGGTDNPTPTVFDASSVVLNGVYVSNGDNRFTSDAYAPLLINKIGRNTNMTLDGVTQTGYDGSAFAGSSLIGDVGDATAHGITLNFSGIVLDGRNNSSTDLGVDTTASLNGVYGSTRSVFIRATLLNSFTYVGESSGTYNFTLDEDWNTSTHAAIHGVTYGSEITTSVEHSGKQNKYSESDTVYTDPSTDNKTTSPYNFTTYFLPYVYVTAVPAEYKHELSVNVNYNITITGFGKYDQPFVIDTGEKLRIISKIIKGDNDLTNAVKIQLPGDLTGYDYNDVVYSEHLYSYGASTFTSSNGGADRSNANVRRYLAGAYYAITDDITLPSDYQALGQTTQEDSHPEYLFHGVIFGSGETRTVTNKSKEPLVHSSNGCVIKNLNVHVATDIGGSNVISLVSSNATYQYGSGQAAYGALIRQILGGDTIIDGVKVTFETGTNAVSFSFTTTGDNNYSRLIPVGGYVGVLVNGGLIFRNMREDSNSDGVYESFVGLTATTYSAVSDAGYLYVNPIIGRVIAGYAFCENCEVDGSADAYAVTSAFSNGTKNYALSNLNPALSKLSVSNSNDQFTITVPNGQAMFVLGAIVNSGAASAAYNASAEQAYASITGFWQAYRQWTATRQGATYDHIGDTTDPDFAAAQADAYDSSGSRKGIPYIIRTYTQKNNNVYFARALTSRANNIVSVTGDCNVAAGFRGIGSLYYDTIFANDRVHLGIESMTGTESPTITLHMSFSEYDGSVTSYRAVNGNYFAATETNVMFGSNTGYGLFTRLYMTGTTGYIEGFTLSGSVNYALRQVSNGNAVSAPTFDGVKGYVVLNVGGLAGMAFCQKENSANYYTSLRIRNVSLSGFSAEGPRYAGGLIGCFVNPQNGSGAKYFNYVTNCPVSTTTVRGGKTAGSYFGYANVGGNNAQTDAARLIISGDSTVVDGVSVKTTVAPTAITVFGAADAWEERMTPAAGGLIGCADVAYNVAGDPYIQIRHVKVLGGTFTATRSSEAAYTDKKYKAGLPAAGGIIGKLRGAKIAVTDCEILRVDMNADAAGGVLGCVIIPRDSAITLERILIDGDKGESTRAEMSVRFHAAGVIGRMFAKNNSTYSFSDIRVQNYNFTSDFTGIYGTAAGVLGSVWIEEKNDKSFLFKNLSVTDCTMTANTSTSGPSYRKGVGGLFGALSGINNQTTYTGYNLLVNATLAGSGTGNAGAVLGNNVNNTAIVKLVGVSANVNPGTKTLSYTENTNGYSVYADFSQVSTNTAYAGIGDGEVNTDDYTDVTAAAPYVTVNPAVVFGTPPNTQTVTGDSTADSVANLPIQALLTEYAGGSRRYGYAGAAYYSGGSGDTNYAVFNAVKNSALTMFSAETLGYTGTDFPVLVIETTEENVTHRMINSYIRLLTNTRDDYGADVAGKYQVVIYNMVYDNGVFTPVYGEASLKRLSGKFRMTNTAYDSGKLQFSLIDVRFFDPADASKVAYHLYVPVFVKKILTFEFDVAAASGTTYLENQYTTSFGQRLIANVGAPVTLYFRYTYSRTAAEWETAINAGETPHRHYDKQLTLRKANNNAVLKNFDEGKNTETILVLVDKNDGGKPYYAKLSDALSGSTINLSAFKETMGRDGSGNYTFSGNSFAPRDFADMLSLTVNSTGDGRTMVACAANVATVTVNGQGYRPATESELEDGSVAKYSISVGAISGTYLTEKYYLSIYTEGDAEYDLFHYFIVTSPSSLLDGVTYPARIADTDAHTMVHLVMGKIFDHSSLNVSSVSNRGSLLMTSGENNTLITTLSVQIGISSALGDLRDEVRGYVNATGFYQSFLIYLTRHVGGVQNKAILGNPTVAGSYGVNVAPNTAYQNADVHVTQTFAEFVTGNLGSAFAGVGNYTMTVNASVTLAYTLEGAVLAQFPGRNGEEVNGEEENGVTLSASSNIAFSPTTTSYSKNSISRDDSSGHSYYSEADVENATLFCQPFGDRSGDFTPFGINALNNPPETLEILPTLDFTPIISQVRGQYSDAVVTVTLRQRQSNGTYGASDIANIAQYIPSLRVGDVVASNAGHQSYYSAVISGEDLTENPVTIDFPHIVFSVLTGTEFETAGFTYGNYRLTVTVVLRDENEDEITASKSTDYVIYTNAKVVPSFITVTP